MNKNTGCNKNVNSFCHTSALICLVMTILFLEGGTANAQEQDTPLSQQDEVIYDTSLSGARATRSEKLYIRDKNKPRPAIPYFPEVTYQRPPVPQTVSEQVSSVKYGIDIIIDPKYDHYGYEIRRFMVGVLNPEVYTDLEKINDELFNIEKAKIVAEYWSKHIRIEAKEIKENIEKSSASNNQVQRILGHNLATANIFFADLNQWIQSNKKNLDFLKEHYGQYGFEDPVIVFDDVKKQREFEDLLKDQQAKLDKIRAYGPFTNMPY